MGLIKSRIVIKNSFNDIQHCKVNLALARQTRDQQDRVGQSHHSALSLLECHYC